ncbi:MAG: tetratricopeptide (TPR) repeat protein [Candidatus Latescibacterota bacterium]|jgi:tetratricopeptide (TPR) repeat protein
MTFSKYFSKILFTVALLATPTIHADERPPAAATARTIAMGGSVTALGDDASTSFWNPSGVARLQRTEMAWSYADRYGIGLKANYGSFVFPIFENQALGIDFLRESFDDSELGDAFQIFNTTYGIRLHPTLSLGLSGKLVSHTIDLNGASLRNAKGFGFDLGLLYTPKFKPFNKLRLGLTLQDVSGTKVRDDNTQREEEIFEQKLRLGAAFQAHRNLLLSLDVDDRLYTGAEYQLASTMTLRGGLNYDLSAPADADNTMAFALGFGVKLKNLKLDYAFENHPALPATHHLSMALSYNPSLVTIKDALVRQSPVFKSLYKTYEATDFVDVVIKNSSSESLPVTVSIDIPTLTKTPHEQSITLPPNSTDRYGFKLTFPQDILSTQSSYYDNLVQPTIQVTYAQGRSNKTTTKRINSVYVLGKGKLSWSNSRRIAAFVTPQSKTVDNFARTTLSQYSDLLNRKFPKNNMGKAALMFDALSTYGLRYQQDQTTPFLKIFEDDSVFDTVQYPYEFLQSKVGDCDDCAAIFCSMLENLNIPTAALDVNDPEFGHIYMMFDSGIDISDAGDFFTNEKEYVIWEGGLWIPVETTLFGQSFSDAWRNGAKEYYHRKERGFINEIRISDAQQTFQPGVVPDADIALPTQAQIDPLFQRDLAFFDNRLDQIAMSSGVSLDSAEGLYDAGATYLRLNQLDRALETFNQAIAMDATMADAHNAKGVVLVKQRNYGEALQHFNTALSLNPNDAGYRINVAIAYHLQGNKDGATQAYQQAVSANRDFAGVLDFLGRASDAVRAAAPSIDPIQKAAAQKAYDDGAAFLRLSRFDRAKETLDRALSLNPQNADALNAKGVIETKQRNYQDALNLFNQAITLDSSDAGFYANRAIVYHLLGRKDDALREYAQAVRLDSEYRGQLDAIGPLPDSDTAPVVSSSVTSIQALTSNKAYDDGAAFLRLKALDKATDAFDRALSFNAQNADALNGKGVIAIKQRNYQDALQHIDKATSLDPKNAGFYINKAVVYHLMGRKDDANTAYQKAISLDNSVKGQLDDFLTSASGNNKPAMPASGGPPTANPVQQMAAERIYTQGAAQLRLNRFDPAKEAFDRALALNPKNADVFNGKGVIETKQRNYQTAIELFEKALAFDPNNAGFYLNKAIVYHLMGRKNDANIAYQKAISLDNSVKGQLDNFLTSASTSKKPAMPASGGPLTASPIQRMAAERIYTEGAAHLRLSRFDRAKDTFDRALALDPKNADALNGKGVIETKQRNYQTAIELFEKALAFDPNNAGFYVNKAIAYHLLGKKTDAIQTYQKAIELDPNYQGYLEVLEK